MGPWRVSGVDLVKGTREGAPGPFRRASIFVTLAPIELEVGSLLSCGGCCGVG